MQTARATEADIVGAIEGMTSAFAAGDLDRILAAYEPDAVVVGRPGRPSRGQASLRAMFAEYVAQGVAFTYGAHEVVAAGDIALHLMQWTAPGPDGPRSALSVAVLRRHADAWKMVIDHPFGDSVLRTG